MTYPFAAHSGPAAMTPLFRLVYRSESVIAGPAPTFREQIERIMRSSQRNNAACEVTGALFVGTGCFAQVLEGPMSAVERTFERIGRDERHRTIMVLDMGSAGERAFPGWSMTLVDGPKDVLPPAEATRDPTIARMAAGRIVELLHAATAVRR